MQSCGGRRGGAVDFAVDRLIFGIIRQLLLNIRRKRHCAYFGEDILKHTVEDKFHHAFAFLPALGDFGGKLVGKDDFRADIQFFARTNDATPMGVIDTAKEQKLNLARKALSMPDQTGGNDLGIIDDEDVAGVKIVQNVGKHFVFPFPRLAVNDQKTRRVPGLRGVLGDQFFG